MIDGHNTEKVMKQNIVLLSAVHSVSFSRCMPLFFCICAP